MVTRWIEHARTGVGRAVIGALALGILGTVPASHAGDLGEPPWAGQLRAIEEALGRRALDAALRAAHQAYAAALRSQRWDGLLEIGDAYRRIGEATGDRQGPDARAREAYLRALARARQQSSVDGVLRVAEAFAALGDTDAVTRCLRIAERLASGDPDAQADVRALAARVSDLTASRQPAARTGEEPRP